MAGGPLLHGVAFPARVQTRVELARQQWQEGYRRLQQEARSPGAEERLGEQVEAVTAELRRRLGSSFTLAELAHLYEGCEGWTQEVVARRCPEPGWARWVATAADAAFHLYARGARDYRP